MLDVPELSLVVLVGISGSGKSTFAARAFGPYEVLSSDYCRALVSGDENDQSATSDAFDVLHYIAGKRLAAGRLTVVDATNVQPDARRGLIQLARDHDVLPVAIVLDVPKRVCAERNRARPDRQFGDHVVSRQHAQLRRTMRHLSREGFRAVHVLDGVEQIDAATINRTRMFADRRDDHGPFDVIGDVHGCRSELETLLGELGYRIVRDDDGRAIDAIHPGGRRAVFLGDLVDRGPDTPGVLRLAMGMTGNGHALAVPGNHENKLVRALRGRGVQLRHGLAESMEQLGAQTDDFRESVVQWCDALTSHLVLDDGRLVVAHAGLKEEYHGRASGRVRSFALYGDTTGESDEYGLPVRYPWASDYRGRAMVLYGHTPTVVPEWINNTLCLDTGCVFGGRLTALRYPERTLVSVPAERVWSEPARPLAAPADTRRPDDLRVQDVLGKRIVATELMGAVTIREENAAGAFEAMRFTAPPGWLRYLPPTMSPVETSSERGLLEHPAEAFSYFRGVGVDRVICEEKHMGSRAVVVLPRDDEVAERVFGAPGGAVYTRTGRPFFPATLTSELVGRLRAAADRAGLWERLTADWVMLDTEILPWSVKAGQLMRQQYAAVGAAGRTALAAALDGLRAAADTGREVTELMERTRRRAENIDAYANAYRRYHGDTDGLTGVGIAVFQVLAATGETFETRDHEWHLAVADSLVEADPELFRRTGRQLVDLGAADSEAAATTWWRDMTASGGEGMVVKPWANLVRHGRVVVQPGLKVRGPEYLRIIYGPDYLEPENLDRLRARAIGRKRSLAQREYVLGLEALRRTAAEEPLWRVHEAVTAVLALEVDPVDPRL